MAGTRTLFRCNECGYETSKWLGKCPDCGTWNSIIEEAAPGQPPRASGRTTGPNKSVRLGATSPVAAAQVLSEIQPMRAERVPTGFTELDSVLGGGVVPGSLILLGGEPGIGKSTLLLQVFSNLAASLDDAVILVSGEESADQIKLRASRIGAHDSLLVLPETNLEVIADVLSELKPRCAVIDSIQTMYHPDVASAPGSVSQVREGAAQLMRLAKTLGIAIFIVGHVTKDGAIAGPRLLEHMVDTVLYFEGDMHQNFRILRATKNRFGSTGELAIFSMGEEGLCQVENPSELFLPAHVSQDGDSNGSYRMPSGAAIVAVAEGRRALLAEVQSLVSPTSFGTPRRLASGLDSARLALILAVMQQRGGVPLDSDDVYVSVSGGLKIDDPGSDLAIALAVYSAKRDIALPHDLVVFGEITLAGEIRPVSGYRKRIDEARALGYKRILAARAGKRDKMELREDGAPADLIEAATLSEALEWALTESRL